MYIAQPTLLLPPLPDGSSLAKLGAEAKTMGQSNLVDVGPAICKRTYYLYILAKVDNGDYTELGEVEVLLSEQPVQPPPGMAAILLCVAKASAAWHARAKSHIDDWLPPAYGSRCCSNRRLAHHQLFRPGTSPADHWRAHLQGGEVWRRYRSLVSSAMNKCVTAAEDRDMDLAAARGAAKALLGDFADPLQAYRSMLVERGYVIPDSPIPPSPLARACHAKYLHTFESEQVEQLLQILKDASTGEEDLDFLRVVVPGAADQNCLIS